VNRRAICFQADKSWQSRTSVTTVAFAGSGVSECRNVSPILSDNRGRPERRSVHQAAGSRCREPAGGAIVQFSSHHPHAADPAERVRDQAEEAFIARCAAHALFLDMGPTFETASAFLIVLAPSRTTGLFADRLAAAELGPLADHPNGLLYSGRLLRLNSQAPTPLAHSPDRRPQSLPRAGAVSRVRTAQLFQI
jgi:hypothetical protein